MNDALDTTAFAAFLSQRGRLDEGALLTDGDEIDGWRVLGFLGRGGNGEVYRVRRTENDTFAALKILCRDEPAARRRFALEEEVLSREREAALPSLLATGEHGGRPYFVMELLEPVEVPREESAIARYLLEVCAAVATLHARGLVHRDIKPTNIMRRTDGCLVLIDVGLAKEETELPRPREGISLVAGAAVGVGTPGYAAPEQFQGGRVSPLADIHALGRLAYAAFGGNPPRCWVPIIRRATSSIPEQRFGSVEELACAIRARNRGRRIWSMFVWGALPCLLLVGGAVVGWRMCGEEWWRWNRLCARVVVNDVRQELVSEHVTTQIVESARGRNRRCPPPMPLLLPTRVYRTVSNRVEVTRVCLNGATNVFVRPLVLDAGCEYRIEGPGVLDAALKSSGTGTVVRLQGCEVLNRTTEPPEQSGIRYFLDGKVYLNFVNVAESRALAVRKARKDCFCFDGDLNYLRFQGPLTIQGLRRQLETESFIRINNEINRNESERPRRANHLSTF